MVSKQRESRLYNDKEEWDFVIFENDVINLRETRMKSLNILVGNSVFYGMFMVAVLFWYPFQWYSILK